jgi:hypothetical protein
MVEATACLNNKLVKWTRSFAESDFRSFVTIKLNFNPGTVCTQQHYWFGACKAVLAALHRSVLCILIYLSCMLVLAF